MFRKTRTLNISNIDSVIRSYIKVIEEIPLKFQQESFLLFFEHVKRQPIKSGFSAYSLEIFFKAFNHCVFVK